MTFSAILEVGLGLALVYYLLSLVVSYITSWIAKQMNLRAKDLEEGLKDLITNPEKLQEFKNHEWIKNLKPKQLKILGGYTERDLENLSASTFAQTLFDILLPGEKTDASLTDIRKAIEDHLKGDAQTALLKIFDSGVSDLKEARKSVEDWFNDAMENVSSIYKQHARRIAIVVALAVTLVTGVDSVGLAIQLWENPVLRAGIPAQVDQYIDQEPDGDVQTYIEELEALEFPIQLAPIWDPDTWPDDATDISWKVVGLLITWIAVSQGSSFWYQSLKKIRSWATAPTTKDRIET